MRLGLFLVVAVNISVSGRGGLVIQTFSSSRVQFDFATPPPGKTEIGYKISRRRRNKLPLV